MKSANTIPAITILPPSDAQCYLSASRWFFAGAEALARCTVKELTSCVFLAAQSLECVLKAYLSHSKIDKKDLMKPSVRHNLELLWRMASNKGLAIPLTPAVWCETLNTAHNKPFYMRYPMGGINITNPVVSTMTAELKAIINNEVAKYIKI
jgi:hypothetical protein